MLASVSIQCCVCLLNKYRFRKYRSREVRQTGPSVCNCLFEEIITASRLISGLQTKYLFRNHNNNTPQTECEGRQERGKYSVNVCISHTEIRQCYIRVILFRDAHASFDLQDFINQEQDGSELIITTQPDGQKWLFSSGRRMIICTLNLLLNLTNPDKSSTAFVIFVYFKENVWVFMVSFLANVKSAHSQVRLILDLWDFINRFYCVSGGNVKSDLIVSVMEKTHIKEHLSLTKCMIWGIVNFHSIHNAGRLKHQLSEL